MSVDPRTPDTGDWDGLVRELREISRRLETLEAPSGTQAFRTVAKLSALVNNIQQQLDEYNASRWTNAQIQAQINAAIAAAFSGDRTFTGSLTVNGALVAASLGTAGALSAGGAVTLPDVFNTNIVGLGGSRKTVWVRDGGRMGNTA